MSDEAGPSSPKKVRLDERVDVVDVDRDEGKEGEDAVMHETEAASSKDRSQHLHAARLRAHLQRLPKDLDGSRIQLAWSATNTIAIARSTRIALIHLNAPSRVCHLATPFASRASLITFSPRGDALLGCFPDVGVIRVWTNGRGTLNEWQVSGEMKNVQGRVLDVRWLESGTRRVHVSDAKRRTTAHGPQLFAGMSNVVSALLITDIGHLTFLRCSVQASGSQPFTSSLHKLSLSSHQRLQHAAIGLVPDEPLALLAFSKRLSSKVNASNVVAPGSGHALGMFFNDDGDVAEAANAAATDVPLVTDGEDKIELSEIRFYLDDDDDEALQSEQGRVSLFVRPLSSIFTASFDEQFMPYTKSMTQLFWLETPNASSSQNKEEASSLRLFASFFEDNTTTMRWWAVTREDTNKLSSAFSKLESSKESKKSGEDDDEDWTASDPHHKVLAGELVSDFVVCPWSPQRLMCCVSPTTDCVALGDVPPLSVQYRSWDVETMTLGAGGINKTFYSNLHRLAISPHGTLAAGVRRGKVSIASIRALMGDSDDVNLFNAALMEGDDVSDLIYGRSSDLGSMGERLFKDHGQTKTSEALQIVSLCARKSTLPLVNRRMCRTILELANSFRLIAMSGQEKGSRGYQLAHVWTLSAQLEWHVSLLEMTARQAYVLAHASQKKPEDDGQVIDAEVATEEPDLLSLFAYPFLRLLLVRNIIQLVAFCNWLTAMVDGSADGADATSTAAKEEFKAYALRFSLQLHVDEKPVAGSRVANALSLCHARVREILLQSPIDLALAGRFFKTFASPAPPEGAEAEAGAAKDAQRWCTGERASLEQRTALSNALLASSCVRDTLKLFCPPIGGSSSIVDDTSPLDDDEDEADGTEERAMVDQLLALTEKPRRDTLTKAVLGKDGKAGNTLRLVCLTCQGETQVDVRDGVRCVCGAKTWWRTAH